MFKKSYSLAGPLYKKLIYLIWTGLVLASSLAEITIQI